MKNLRVINSLLAASFLAFSTPVLAGPTTLIFDAAPLENPTGGAILGNGEAYTQTFTNIETINDIAFRFVVADTTNFGLIELSVYLNEWSGSNAEANELVTAGGLGLAASGDWTAGDTGYMYFDAGFNLGSFTLDAGKVYGLSIVGNTVTDSLNIFLAAAGNAYSADTFLHTGVTQNSDLTSGGTGSFDFGFVAADANTFAPLISPTPIPEASTAAVLFAGLFVGMMLTRRQYRPRTEPAGAA